MVEIELHDGKKPVMLRWDDTCWALCYKRSYMSKADKDSEAVLKESWNPEKFYSNPVGALSALANMKIGNSNAKSLTELAGAIESVRSELSLVYSTDVIGARYE